MCVCVCVFAQTWVQLLVGYMEGGKGFKDELENESFRGEGGRK